MKRFSLRLLKAVFAFAVLSVLIFTLQTIRGGGPKMKPVADRAWPDGFSEYRGIVHCHSNLSYDSWGDLEDIAAEANRHHIDFLVMTDHWSSDLFRNSYKGMHGTTLFISGLELERKNKMSLLTFPLPADFAPSKNVTENIASLEKKGALVFGAHIELASDEELYRFGQLEIMNLHAYAMRYGKYHALRSYLHSFLLGGDIGFLVGKIDAIGRWEKLEFERNMGIPMFTGNDTHKNYALMLLFGRHVYGRTFDIVTTHVLVRKFAEKDIVEALGHGNSYTAVEALGSPEGFRFYAQGGSSIFLPGDTFHLDHGQFFVFTRPNNATDARCTLRKNGKVFFSTPCDENDHSLSIPLTEKGIYHAEIMKGGKTWIITNSIVVK